MGGGPCVLSTPRRSSIIIENGRRQSAATETGERGRSPIDHYHKICISNPLITLHTHTPQDDRLYSDKYTPYVDKNKQIFGNQSRFAKNWACGPNHMIRNQQVPGYTGHIKGLISENLFSKSYGNSTA